MKSLIIIIQHMLLISKAHLYIFSNSCKPFKIEPSLRKCNYKKIQRSSTENRKYTCQFKSGKVMLIALTGAVCEVSEGICFSLLSPGTTTSSCLSLRMVTTWEDRLQATAMTKVLHPLLPPSQIKQRKVKIYQLLHITQL